jgi:hypothetical protein
MISANKPIKKTLLVNHGYVCRPSAASIIAPNNAGSVSIVKLDSTRKVKPTKNFNL